MGMQHKALSFLSIGLFWGVLNAQELTSPLGEQSPDVSNDREPAATETTFPDEPVIVEKRPLIWDGGLKRYRVPYYRYRRETFGLYFQAGMHQYNPSVVRSQQTLFRRSTQYQGTVPNTFEAQLSPRLGTRIGAFALDMAYSEYAIKTTDENSANLSIKLPRVGISYIMDTLMPEPYVAPYVSVGVYQAQYRQQDSGTQDKIKEGDSEVVAYYAVGVLLQTNWLDATQSEKAYEDFGLENTYIFAEARSYSATDAGDIPSLGSDTVFAAGVKVEF